MAVKGLTPGYLRRGTDGDLVHKEGRGGGGEGGGVGVTTIPTNAALAVTSRIILHTKGQG